MNKNRAARRIAKTTQPMLPDPTVAGEPFWVLMAERNGELTENYHALRKGPKHIIPLFLTRGEAERVLAALPAPNTYVLRGVTKEHLGHMLKLVGRQRGLMELAAVLHAGDPNELKVLPLTPSQIHYIRKHGDLPPPP